ncbi:hypothetical protein [Dolichospermum flos-aquae]|uniref:Uncharacterized protein n=1 Tax=Dolichospermum flos-aquae LEGE 04289 TaxID=1828708 RepID=A0ACC5PXQ5_DOLFA|nr:hypothetical protein [Dolichospermum flos-aquae]MBE9217334.1 hypothetical protein [Dolichospermum flos-aquae LEGE 04289]
MLRHGDREQGTLNWELLTGKRFWATLLFVTYVVFFLSPTYTYISDYKKISGNI